MSELIEQHPFFLAQLRRHEGCRRDANGRHIAYRCPAGALTIGYGHNLDANPIKGLGVGMKAGMGGGPGAGSAISEVEAREILSRDVRAVAVQLDARLPWWRQVGEARSAVLLNMAFNMGVDGLLSFTNTLEAVREGRWADAKSGMLASRWAGQVKSRAVELANQMLTGKWQKGA